MVFNGIIAASILKVVAQNLSDPSLAPNNGRSGLRPACLRLAANKKSRKLTTSTFGIA